MKLFWHKSVPKHSHDHAPSTVTILLDDSDKKRTAVANYSKGYERGRRDGLAEGVAPADTFRAELALLKKKAAKLQTSVDKVKETTLRETGRIAVHGFLIDLEAKTLLYHREQKRILDGLAARVETLTV